MKRKDILSFNTKGLSVRRYFCISLIFISIIDVSAQLKLDFNSGNFTDVKWEGNISHFKINTEGQLQLNATAAGESQIFTKYKIPPDSIQVDLYFKLQFAPSNDNFGKIYIFTDNTNESLANGYYLRLGENGSNDAIQVWKLENGVPSLMGSGRMGGISADPADARIQCKIYRDGLWLMATDYTGKVLYEDDLEFSDPAFVLQDSMYFGLYCKYSSTRADKFFYDDIQIKTIEKDTIAPGVVAATVIDATTIKITFTEGVEEFSAKNTGAYMTDNGLGNPESVQFTATSPNDVILKYNTKKIESGIFYTLTIDGVGDRSNNKKKSVVPFVLTIKPQKGDLVISEVLSDPYSGGDDFIELYNISDKFLKLDSLILKNAEKNESRSILTDFVLFPKEYVAISRNTEFLKTTYKTPTGANFISATLPSFNVDAANFSIISVIDKQLSTIDSFDYDETYHFQLIDETKGVGLERINMSAPTNDKNNWHSAAAQVNYGTPGYRNSNFSDPENFPDEFGVVPDKKTFTPDGDNVDDFILLNYNMEKPGYLATVRIFDAEGFPIVDLANNFLLGTGGSIKWDGVDGEGNAIRMGIYIIMTRLFHPDGNVINYRHAVVVANKF
jgi:Lamin Tail Domain